MACGSVESYEATPDPDRKERPHGRERFFRCISHLHWGGGLLKRLLARHVLLLIRDGLLQRFTYQEAVGGILHGHRAASPLLLDESRQKPTREACSCQKSKHVSSPDYAMAL